MDPLGLDSIFCLPHADRGDAPLQTTNAVASGEFGPYEPENAATEAPGDGGPGGCPVSLDGVVLSFGLGDELSGGGFSGGGSASTNMLITPPAGSDMQPLQIEHNPGGAGWCYVNPTGQPLCGEDVTGELGLPDPNQLGMQALLGGQASALGPVGVPGAQSSNPPGVKSSLAGVSTLFTDYSRLTRPLMLTEANGFIFGTGAAMTVLGAGEVLAGCFTPGVDIFTCAPSVGAAFMIVGPGVGLIGFSGYFLKHVTIPAWENWGN